MKTHKKWERIWKEEEIREFEEFIFLAHPFMLTTKAILTVAFILLITLNDAMRIGLVWLENCKLKNKIKIWSMGDVQTKLKWSEIHFYEKNLSINTKSLF